MRAQGRRAASGVVWADWFLELEELLYKRRIARRVGPRQDFQSAGSKARR